MKHFLAWKEVRKTAKTEDEKGPGEGDFDVAGEGVPTGPLAVDPATKPIKTKKAKVRLPWDVHSFYNVIVPDKEDDEVGADELAEDEEMNAALMERLRANDERTQNMTREEYVHFSECRQSSFTFRKAKRFREWAGIGVLTEAKLDPDIQDILGFLTFEMVQTLTESALRIKAEEDAMVRLSGTDVSNGGSNNLTGFAAAFGRGAGGDMTGTKRKRDDEDGFEGSIEERTPVEIRHIQEAFRLTQAPRPMDISMQFTFGRNVLLRRPLRFI